MKVQIQKNQNDLGVTIEIPNTVDLTHLSKGEFFPVYISDEKNQVTKKQACLLADGRSFLIGTQVVRIQFIEKQKKKDLFKVCMKNGKLVTQNSVYAKVIRPVEPKSSSANAFNGDLKSPMTGKIISIPVSLGAHVKEGDVLIVIEAMKMENRVVSDFDGIVKTIKVTEGSSVNSGDLLLTLEPKG